MCSTSVIDPAAARWKSVGRRRLAGLTVLRYLFVASPLARLHRVIERGGLIVRDLGDQRLAAGLGLRLAVDIVVAKTRGLSLDDAQRATQTPGRVRQALCAEQQDEHHHQDDDVPRLYNTTHWICHLNE